jgi:hypothetical protein
MMTQCLRVERCLGIEYAWTDNCEANPFAALDERLQMLTDEYDALTADREADDRILIELIDQIETTLSEATWSFETDLEDDDPHDALGERVSALINEYDAMTASQEDTL